MKQNAITNSSKRNPKISIMLITYNHEKYIAQAIESILMQETEYDYEIVVIEDCSTDKTQEVIMKYVEKYPDKVKPYFNKINLGHKVTQHNFYQGYYRLTGDYMAILEGDDYWTSPHKLQKQVSFLENNPEYVACAHNTIKIYEDGSKEPHRFIYYENMPEDHSIESFIMITSYFHTTTLLFRNVFRGKPPLHFRNKWSCEIFIVIAHTQFGKIRYFDEDMAVYRAHAGGCFSTMTKLQGWFFNVGGLRRYNQWLKYRYLKTFSRSIIRYCNNMFADKGKEAALLTPYQYLKYFSIRTTYQIIYYFLCPLDKLWRNIRDNKTLITKNDIRYCFNFPFSMLRQFLHFILPETTKNKIKAFERSHPRVRHFRLHTLPKVSFGILNRILNIPQNFIKLMRGKTTS